MNSKPNIEDIRRYVRGEMSPREMFELERLAEADEMIMDILQGVQAEFDQGINPIAVQELNQNIHRRTTKENAQAEPIIEKEIPQTTRRKFPYRWIASAAAVLLVFGVGTTYWLNRDPNQEIASMEPLNIGKKKPSVAIQEPNINAEQYITSEESALANSPEKNSERLAYSGQRNKPKAKRESGRLASLDTFPIQIIPSNAEELVSQSLGYGKSEQIAYQEVATAPRTASRMANSAVSMSPRASNLDAVSLNEIKSITTGIVLDGQTQKPISGATIRSLDMENAITTDATGKFILGSKTENANLLVQAAGFEPTQRIADGAMRIELMPLVSAVKKTNGANSSIRSSKPTMDLFAYQQHIDSVAQEKNMGHGEVTLSFHINANGKPTDIAVKKSAGAKLDRQAIRIIQNGPAWIRGTNKEAAEWTIRF